MKDVLSLAVFVGQVLCLMVFVTILKPDSSIGAIQTSTKPVDCRIERSGMQECGLNLQRLGKPTPGHALHVRASLTAE
jgi:hypothetical protein